MGASFRGEAPDHFYVYPLQIVKFGTFGMRLVGRDRRRSTFGRSGMACALLTGMSAIESAAGDGI